MKDSTNYDRLIKTVTMFSEANSLTLKSQEQLAGIVGLAIRLGINGDVPVECDHDLKLEQLHDREGNNDGQAMCCTKCDHTEDVAPNDAFDRLEDFGHKE